MPSDSMDCLLVVFAKATINISRTRGYGYEQTLNAKKYISVCNLSQSHNPSKKDTEKPVLSSQIGIPFGAWLACCAADPPLNFDS